MTAARPRQRNTQREWSLQRSIVVYLSKALPLTAYFTSIDIGSAGSAQAGQLRKARGVKPGIADIMVIWSGTVLFLEIKAGTQPSEAQKLFRDQVTANGCWWALARCPEDVEQACILAGIPLRATFSKIHQRIAEQNERLPAKRKRAARRKGSGSVSVAAAHRLGLWNP
jgi:hypothetical protein